MTYRVFVNNTNLYFQYKAGKNWSMPTILDSENCSSPSIAVTPGDLLHIVWQRENDDNGMIFYKTTLDKVHPDDIRNIYQPEWSEPFNVSYFDLYPTEPASNPSTEAYGEYVYAAWRGPYDEVNPIGEIWRRARNINWPPDRWLNPRNMSETRDNESNYPVMSTDFVTVWQESIADNNWDIWGRFEAAPSSEPFQGQLMIKRVSFLQAGADYPSYILTCDSDHDGLNEIIFATGTIHSTNPLRWEVWEHRPMNRYELVFADTGAYPYPPGITTGNFLPYDIGDIDRDSLTDLVGPNNERINDSTFYIVATQESPNYTYYPSFFSWWQRVSNRGPGSINYFTPDLDRDGAKEILTCEGFYGDTTRLMLIENIGNNQNISVWRRFTYGANFTFGDFDQDSLRDFVTANPGSSGEIYFFENTGDNQYDRTTIDIINLPNGSDVFSGNDLDGDEKPEFFVAFYSYVSGMNYLYMWEATGNNTYQRTLIDQVSGGDWAGKRSKCGDIDGDGIEELVWSIGGRVMVYKATGNNQFQRIWDWNNDHGGQLPSAVVNVYDMNNNGYKEIVIGGSGKTSIFEVEAVRLLRPNGGEVFQVGAQELIRWQKFYPPRCDSLSLFYSIDNGNNYTMITHGLSGDDTSYLWAVPNVTSDSCRIKIIAYGPGWQYDESDGIFSISSLGISEIASLPLAMTLQLQVFPNPAKSVVRVRYSIPSPSPKPSPIKGEGLMSDAQRITLNLHDISGRLVKTLVNENQKPGNYSLTLNTKTLSSGIYFLYLQTDDKRIIERLVVIR